MTQTLSDTTTAEVVVIGGGYTGLSTALHLAERGVEVVLLEAVEIGFGGAGRNVGLVNAGMWVMPDALTNILGPDAGERLIEFLADGPALVWDLIDRHGIDCEATRSGTLHVAPDQAGLDELVARHAQWKARGAPVELLDRDATDARLGTGRYLGALHDRRAGTIHPLSYARGLAKAAIGAGARIFTRSPAVTMHGEGAGWRIKTPSGSVAAAQIVFATDAYSRHLMPEIRTQQVFLPYFNIATEALPEALTQRILPGREGVWDTKKVLTSFRMDKSNRLILGSVGALRNTGGPIHRAWARRALRRLYPALSGIRFEAEWHGTIGMTSDHLPRFHQLADGVVTICGYNGRGIAPGTAFGRALADWLCGGNAGLPLAPSKPQPDRLRLTKGAFYEFGAQAWHLVDARL
ncbi:MAG: FAD-binding oxidoreductase [Paracoccus sp. (in: a-proteobacteria)]|nr:FAD-binding oxidoreductase [Paracoccus sp. (in: a-proteobacteria)]